MFVAVTEQHLRLGHPRHHYISEGDVIAVLAAIEKATQHRVEPNADHAPKTGTTRKTRVGSR